MNGYDYASVGAYFITICTKDRKRLFWIHDRSGNLQKPVGAITNRPPVPYRFTDLGVQVQKAIENIPQYYKNICIDCYCIMPDHVHILLCILPPEEWFYDNDGRLVIAPTDKGSFVTGKYTAPDASNIIRQFKSAVTKQTGTSIWQKSFHDRIIRNQNQMKFVRRYIADNPLRWQYDHGDSADPDVYFREQTP